MKVPLINISSESIIGVPALVHFDSQFENEPLYAMLGLTLQTRDGKENPPRFATYYAFEKKEYPLCYGFCSVLFNWALLEAYNRFILAYPDTKVVLKTSDLCFDYEEFVPVDELCKLYLERIKIPYKVWLTCSPKLRHYTDSDSSLFSRLLFDEYENLLDFSNRGIFSDFTEKQREDFITWWECIEDYITRHYKIEIPLHSISEKVMDYLLETERFRLPKGYTLSSYSPNAKFCLDRTKNTTEDKTTYHINIMPTHIYHDNAQHIDHSKTITINGASIDDLGGFLRDFMSDEPLKPSAPAAKNDNNPKTAPKTPEKRPKNDPVPFTISYVGDLAAQARSQRLHFVRRVMEKLGWFHEIQDADDFEHLFSGKHRECNIHWSKSVNIATAYYFLQQLLQQPYITKETGCTARSLLINQFHVKNARADESRVSDFHKECIRRILILLNPANPLPSSRNYSDNDLDIMNDMYWNMYQDNLNIRKGV